MPAVRIARQITDHQRRRGRQGDQATCAIGRIGEAGEHIVVAKLREIQLGRSGFAQVGDGLLDGLPFCCGARLGIEGHITAFLCGGDHSGGFHRPKCGLPKPPTPSPEATPPGSPAPVASGSPLLDKPDRLVLMALIPREPQVHERLGDAALLELLPHKQQHSRASRRAMNGVRGYG